MILWDISLVNVQVQFDQADELLVPHSSIDLVEWEIRRDRRRDMFHLRGWLIAGGIPPWEQPYDVPRRRWVSRLLELLRLWPSIKSAHPMLKDLHTRKGLLWESMSSGELDDIIKERLTVKETNNLERELISVFCQGVFDSLGVLTVALMKRPKVSTLVFDKFRTI